MNISDRVKEIKDSAFYKCFALKYVELFDSVKEIGDEAFMWCSSLYVEVPEGVKVGKNAFHGTKLDSVDPMIPLKLSLHR